MDKREVLQFFRDFKSSMDERIKSNKEYKPGEMFPEVVDVCNMYILKQIEVESALINEMYVCWLECDAIRNNSQTLDKFMNDVNVKYLEYAKRYDGLKGELLKKMMLAHINQMIIGMEEND